MAFEISIKLILLVVLTCLKIQIISGALSEVIRNATISLDEEPFARETVTIIGTCEDNKTLVRITSDPAFPTTSIITCHDESRDETLWSKHQIVGPLPEGEGTRPSFRIGNFYKQIDVNNCYSQTTQAETIEKLTGSNGFIDVSQNLYLARGHLAPNADFPIDSQRAATFFYINACPQWQSINDGNWLRLENSLRKLAENPIRTLTVWTGTYGTMKLPAGTGSNIFLGRIGDETVERLPINHLLWKVIYDENAGTGAAIIEINNPYIENVQPGDDIPCPNICDQLSWVDWQTTEVRRGYTHCCTVESFREIVSYFGDFPEDFPEIPSGNIPLLR
ncbi:unnamed protein product [Orchesella dallaii]|uniref:Nuclease EXOG, mitochondrial n=1 Tax=Orchesella dallaii TaxID=48710 RepID=A0ABP1RJ17_9HEXA